MGPNSSELSFGLRSSRLSPPLFGYEPARLARKAANLKAGSPIDLAEGIFAGLLALEVRLEDRNHVPGEGLRAIVGCAPTGAFVTARLLPVRSEIRRFLSARSLYNAIATTRTSQRLVTDAFSWDRKASRAFAAELLAPRQALIDRMSNHILDFDQLKSLSEEL